MSKTIYHDFELFELARIMGIVIEKNSHGSGNHYLTIGGRTISNYTHLKGILDGIQHERKVKETNDT